MGGRGRSSWRLPGSVTFILTVSRHFGRSPSSLVLVELIVVLSFLWSFKPELEGMCEKYQEYSGSSLVLEPSAVTSLSTAALKRNLATHAAYDQNLVVEGTKEQMAERLKAFLEVRQADLVVWEVLHGD